MKVLVFGATGEVGGRIARLAVDAGCKVVGVSRGRNKRTMVDLSGVRMLTGSKREEDFIRDVCVPEKPDAVIDSVVGRRRNVSQILQRREKHTFLQLDRHIRAFAAHAGGRDASIA